MSRIYFIPNRNFWLVLGILLALLIFAAPVFAQDTTPPVFTSPSFPDATNAFVNALLAIFASAIASPITAPLVSLIKRIPLPLVQNASGDALNLFVALLLSAVLWAGTMLGHAADIDTAYKLIFALLPFISGIGANYFSNRAVYQGAKGKMPVLGYSRSEKAA